MEDTNKGTSFANDIYTIGLNLGSSLSGKELTVELYKFNESLTRLLSQQGSLPRDSFQGELGTINSDEETIHGEDISTRLQIDSTLLLKTIIKLLILKLSKIIEILSTQDTRNVELSNIEHKLIDDILIKNISNRILKPYHNLIYLKAQNLMLNVY